MKSFLLLAACVASISTACAADFYVAATAGRLLDQKETYYAGRAGVEFLDTAVISHNAELEYITWDKDGQLLGPANAKGDVTAVMANYRAVATLLPVLRLTAGAGAGTAKIKLSTPSGSGLPINDKNSQFAWQIFASANYTVLPRVDLTLGARYFKFDAEIFGRKDLVGGDTGIEAGVHVRF